MDEGGDLEVLGAQLDVSGVLRALRRRADVSQRELAASSGVPAATVGHIESGTSTNPSLRTVERLVHATGARLAIVDLDGSEPVPLQTDEWRDGAERRFPPHLDPAPETRWPRGVRRDMIGFYRNRRMRDVERRDAAGERRYDLFIEIRRLGPGDTDVLETLRAEAARLDLAGEPAQGPAPGGLPSVESAVDPLRYLRDPSVRHWVAEDRRGVHGQLVAHVLPAHSGPPRLVVTEIGVRPEHRDGLVGPLLAAALCDEAAKLGASEILAVACDRPMATYLCSLGFSRRRTRWPRLLRVPA